MIKYAQNLIGDWETEQFEPLREVAQNKYQANWDKLSSDFANLNEQLAHNFQRARVKHNSAVLDNARNSFNRMYNVEQDLANRGLTGSGLMNVYSAMNTKQQGQENNAALQELMDANKANIEGRFAALDNLVQGMGDLSSRLGDELAGITDAEGDNYRQYRDLIGNISESASSRSSSNAIANAERKLEEEQDTMYQFLTIKDILADEETTADEKYFDLIRDAAVTPEQAERIVSSYSYEKTSNEINKKQNKLDKIKYYRNKNYSKGLRDIVVGIPADVDINSRQKRLDKLNDELSNYTYEDLKKIMGY